MAINPDNITTIRVDQLADDTLGLTDKFPHTVGTELKSSTIQELVDLVATAVGVGSGVGYLPISVTDGQQLPDVPTDPSFFLAGAGTYLNINGFPDLICTEELNAIMSLTDHWEIAVEIPIVPPGGVEITNTSQLINDGEDGVHPYITLLDLPSNLILYPTDVASDITDYYKIVTDIHDADYNTVAVDIPTGTITTTDQLVAELATESNLILGNPGVFNITTIGNIKKVSGSGEARFYFKVYKRVLAGTETLIGTSSLTDAVSSSSYEQFQTNAIWDDGEFLATDRIVLKFYANRVAGGTDPVYDFQFGGSTPVRTLVPIPLSVVPGGVDSVNSQTGVVSIDLESVLTEGNESTTQDAIFRLDADKYLKINRATQKIELWDESIDNTIPIAHWDKDSFYIKDAAGNQMSISAGYTNNLLSDGSTLEIFGSNIVLTLTGNSLNIIPEQMELTSGANGTAYRIDKIIVNGVDYDLPTGATSQIATLLDIPAPITIDATPTDGSSNAVSSNGVFDALALKKTVYYESATPSTAVTGTTSETQISGADFTIPANTINANSHLFVLPTIFKTVATNTTQVRLKFNTTNNYATATTIANFATSGSNTYGGGHRKLIVNGGNIKGLAFTQAIIQDFISSGIGTSSASFPVTGDLYFFWSIQNNASGDSATLESVQITS